MNNKTDDNTSMISYSLMNDRNNIGSTTHDNFLTNDHTWKTVSWENTSSSEQYLTTDLPNDDVIRSSPSTGKIVLCTFLFLVTVVTVIGNTLVILSPYVNKKLRNTFTYFILNLAITDLLVGTTAMSFYTFDVLLGYWPFGEVMCGMWIFFDYGMTFASVFTLVVISVDRYWSVQWSVHYRVHNTTKKCLVLILVIWLTVLATWLAPCVLDRVRWSEPNLCIWEPSRNKEFVIFIALFGHHTPCIIMLFCYAKVYHLMKLRSKVHPASKKVEQEVNQKSENLKISVSIVHEEVSGRGYSSMPNQEITNSGQRENNTKVRRGEKDKRAFKMLGYILLSYLLCWVPFHIVFDISSINPDVIPGTLYTATFWLTYLNSTLNPFVYAFTSSNFREAFIKIMHCDFKTS